MNYFCTFNNKRDLESPCRLLTIGFLIASLFYICPLAKADEITMTQAQSAMENNQYPLAHGLFKELLKEDQFRTRALFGLAKLSFFNEQLDDAKEYIGEVLTLAPNNPEYLFIAGRISGKQAESASIFTKLGYAKEVKRHFTRALEIDNGHQPSLIGLIRFHQRAPGIAGGDKDAIPSLLTRLHEVDKRASFDIQAPYLLEQKNIDQAISLYTEVLNSQSDIDSGRLMFDFAMLLANKGYYPQALSELILIDVKNESSESDYISMRLYQIGKLAAESSTQLLFGLESMTQYASLPVAKRTISKDWIDFRLYQLRFLKERQKHDRDAINRLRKSTSDKALKAEIKSFLKTNK
jgi:tetratricopeptide (TPR) repeat protein